MTSTEIFLEYCQQNAWADESGLVLIPYKRFLDEFDRFVCRRGCWWPVAPGCDNQCVGTQNE